MTGCDEVISPVERYRDGNGHTVYELDAEAFESLDTDAVIG